MKKFLFVLLSLVVILNACKKEPNNTKSYKKYTFYPGTYKEADVQEAMINMDNGDTIYFTQGTYSFSTTLSIDGKSNIVVAGDGRTTTTLDFGNQTTGAEGLKGSSLNFVMFRDFTLQDARGDGIKIKDADGLTFLRVGVVFTSPEDSTNGGYGLYPVTSRNVFIDDCYVAGASDAGIYVVQSQQVIVRNSLVEKNVVGMEIENCINSDVYGMTARNNTGGIAIFDLPNLPVIKNGNTCRVFNNTLINNSGKNFAPSGSIVANVPTGTGIMLLASKKTEVFNNTITENNVMGVGIIAYNTFLTLNSSLTLTDLAYVPYCKEINVHNNNITGSTTKPTKMNNIATLLSTVVFPSGNVPEILYDGFVHPDYTADATKGVCIKNNGTVRFSNMDVPNTFANMSSDVTPHDCSPTALPAVTVVAPGF